MEKSKLIERFKDYSKELEKVLVNKAYSKDAKNLLLNLFYKIDNSYEDYKKVKIEVPTKKDFFQEVIDIIYKDCKYIEFVKPKETTKVTKDKIITYQNELVMLEQIYKINSNQYNIKTENSVIGKELSALLSSGERLNKSEIIRDFDGWSWNTLENKNVFGIPNLIYIGMAYILGYDNLKTIKSESIEELFAILKEKYKTNFAEKLIKNISQIAIVSYSNSSTNNKNEINALINEIFNKYEIIINKKQYIEDISNEKKKIIIESEKISKYLNNDILLKKEYIKQNEKLPQEERVFSLSDFSEKVQKQSDELQIKINELTEKLKPQNYVKEKNKIEKEYNFYKDIEDKNFQIESFIDEFINLLFKAITTKIEQSAQKKDIIDLIYRIRYLNLLRINNYCLGKKYNKQINKIEKNIITVGCNLKVLNIFSKSVEENYLIYKNIFNTRVIDFDSMFIEIKKDKILFYDDEAIEAEKECNKLNDLIVKRNKKYNILLKK